MIKGCRKNMIIVRCGADSRFESAYFIMKNDTVCDEGDLLSEAERIINNGSSDGEKTKPSIKQKGEKKPLRGLIPFAAGATVGSAAGILLFFL